MAAVVMTVPGDCRVSVSGSGGGIDSVSRSIRGGGSMCRGVGRSGSGNGSGSRRS